MTCGQRLTISFSLDPDSNECWRITDEQRFEALPTADRVAMLGFMKSLREARLPSGGLTLAPVWSQRIRRRSSPPLLESVAPRTSRSVRHRHACRAVVRLVSMPSPRASEPAPGSDTPGAMRQAASCVHSAASCIVTARSSRKLVFVPATERVPSAHSDGMPRPRPTWPNDICLDGLKLTAATLSFVIRFASDGSLSQLRSSA